MLEVDNYHENIQAVLVAASMNVLISHVCGLEDKNIKGT